MSLEKAIEHGKEHRKPYTGSKAIFHTCRNHGGCNWCKGDRLYSSLKRAEAMKAREEDNESHTNQNTGTDAT